MTHACQNSAMAIPVISFWRRIRRAFAGSSDEIIKQLKADGWFWVSTEGSLMHFRHLAKKGKVTVPLGRKDMPIMTLKFIEKQSGVKLR